MKITRILSPLLVLAALSLPFSANAQTFKPPVVGDVAVDGVTTELVKTPDYSVSGTTKKRSTPQDWLEVEVGFASNADFIDELTVKVHIKIKQLTANNRYLTGEASYINIIKGKNKFVAMYVAPGSLALSSGGKGVSPGDIEDVGVEILYKGQTMINYNKSGKKEAWWTGLQPLPGNVLNKNQTPYAPLFWDRYEQIKVESR